MLKMTFDNNPGVAMDAYCIPEEYRNCLRIRRDSSGLIGNMALTVIDLSTTSGTVTITPSFGNPLPLFWGWANDGNLIVADSAPQVHSEITGRHVPLIEDMDEVALVEAIVFDGPLSDRTLFKRVKKTQIGERLTFNLSKASLSREWVWVPRLQTLQGGNLMQISEVAERLVRRLAEAFSGGSQSVVLPISGGFDSRLLASFAAENAKDIFAYTFQRGWSYESYCGRRVARKLGARHETFELDRRCYREFARTVVTRSGGMITGMHSHGIYCCEELLPESLRASPRAFGYFGDPVCGAMTQVKGTHSIGATPESLIDIYRQSAFPELLQRYRQEIHADIMQTWAAFETSGSPSHCFLEFWKIQQRQNNLINHLFHFHRAHHGVQVLLPFLEREFADFFLSLPENFREDRKLFKKLAKKIYPEVFSLPSNHFRAESPMGVVEKLLERAESLADRLSPKQTIMLSPFKYEHHDKNIANYLMPDVARGMEVMSGIFGVSPVVPELPLWKQAPAKDFYRIASFGYLLDGVAA